MTLPCNLMDVTNSMGDLIFKSIRVIIVVNYIWKEGLLEISMLRGTGSCWRKIINPQI